MKWCEFDALIENIDIGGPTMIRAAAKNFKYVTTLTSPDDYSSFIDHVSSNQLSTSVEFRQRLMTKAFNHTADYDALIAKTMDASVGVPLNDSLSQMVKSCDMVKIVINLH